MCIEQFESTRCPWDMSHGKFEPPNQPEAAKARCLCIDIETARKDRTILRELGVFRPDLDVRKRLSGKASDLVVRLDALTAGAAFVLGHNVIAHDQPALALLHPGLDLHDRSAQKPAAGPSR